MIGDYIIDNKGGITVTQNTNIVKKHINDFGIGLFSYIRGSKMEKKVIKYYNFETHNQHSHF